MIIKLWRGSEDRKASGLPPRPCGNDDNSPRFGFLDTLLEVLTRVFHESARTGSPKRVFTKALLYDRIIFSFLMTTAM